MCTTYILLTYINPGLKHTNAIIFYWLIFICLHIKLNSLITEPLMDYPEQLFFKKFHCHGHFYAVSSPDHQRDILKSLSSVLSQNKSIFDFNLLCYYFEKICFNYPGWMGTQPKSFRQRHRGR